MTQFQDDVQIDGNLRVGDDPGAINAVVEAHRAGTSTGKPKRGLQVDGEVVNEDNLVNALEWSVHELNLGGGGGKTLGEASALRTALTLDGSQNLNTGVGLDVQVGQKVGATGMLNEAIGLRIGDVTDAANNFAIQTGQGVVQIGDTLALTKDPGAGKVLTSDADGNASWEQPGMILLGSVSLAGVASQQIDCDEDYHLLRLVFYAKINTAGPAGYLNVFVRPIGDGSGEDTNVNSYYSVYSFHNNLPSYVASNKAIASLGKFVVPTNKFTGVETAGLSEFELVLPGCSRTDVYKGWHGHGTWIVGDAAAWGYWGGGYWRSTQKIVGLKIFSELGENFATGSHAYLYGVKI